MTYSLVARDMETGELGVAVQSHFFAVGSLVTWAEAGVGAVATQSFADAGYGPLALAALRDGAPAPAALARLVACDRERDVRQVAVVDARGRVSAYTGHRCVDEAGQLVADGVSAQANMMERGTVWGAMVASYHAARGDLAERLLAALDAAEAEGGDIRGRQSAALLVVSGERSERPWEGVRLDVRVDDHPDPLGELRRLVSHQRAYARLGRVLFQPGAVIGDYALSDGALERALGDLEAAQASLGPNPEPTFWRAVLLARAGRGREAGAALADAARSTPALLEFAARLPAAGLTDPTQEVQP